MMPKALKKAIGKIDPRTKPPEHEVKKFRKDCSRRYINTGITTRDFYKTIAEKLEDDDLKEYAKEIEQAIYTKNGETFETYTRLFKSQMGSLGVWKSVKGLTGYQKARILGSLKRKKKEAEEFKNRSDY